MTAPTRNPRIGTAQATMRIAAWQSRDGWSRVRLLALAVATAVAALLGLAARTATEGDIVGTAMGLGIGLAVPIGCLVIGASLLGDPLADGSLIHLHRLPVPRVAIVAGSTLIGLAAAAVVTVVPLIAFAVTSGHPGLVPAFVGVGLLAVAAYVPISVWLGLSVQRALVWGLVWVVVVEGTIARAFQGLGPIAASTWTGSLLEVWTDQDVSPGGRSAVVSFVVLLVMSAGGIALATRTLRRRDV